MLLQNGYRDAFTGIRYFGAGTTNGAYPFIAGANSQLVGSKRNIFMGDADIDLKSAIPAGARHPVAWQMPQKAGGLSSRNAARVVVSDTAFAVMGLPGQASSTITLNVTDATGGLIVSGSGTATVTLSLDGTILSVASGSGSATVTLTVPNSMIGAEAGIQGNATISLVPTSVITAVGYMSGLSTSETEFSEAALARAVWTAQAADYNEPGSMGEKLNDAGAAGNPWAALIAANNDPDTFGELIQQIAAATPENPWSALLTSNNDPATFGKLVQDLQVLVDELHKLQGLDIANPMTVTPTSRVTGTIVQEISGDGMTTSTVTRTT